MIWHPITLSEFTRFNSDRVHEERAALVTTIVSMHMCYSSPITALAHEVVRNVKNSYNVYKYLAILAVASFV